jgi:hypothetical protein
VASVETIKKKRGRFLGGICRIMKPPGRRTAIILSSSIGQQYYSPFCRVCAWRMTFSTGSSVDGVMSFSIDILFAFAEGVSSVGITVAKLSIILCTNDDPIR